MSTPPRNNGTPWSESDLELLRELYADESNITLGKIFARSPRYVQRKAWEIGLRKSEAYMASGPGQFRPGQQVWNKGMKGLDIGGHATRFKKGQKPLTCQPIGHEREADGYLQRKVTDTGYTPRDYRPVHHLVWEEHTGQPVPKGHALVFRDGDKRNFDLANLELVTRGELMRRNTIHRLPQELAEVCRLQGVLKRVINNRSERHENKRQGSA